MRLLKKFSVASVAVLAAGCIHIDGIEMGQFEQSNKSQTPVDSYRCENGYRVAVSVRGKDRILMTVKNGKDTFVIYANKQPSGSGAYYVGQPETVKWHQKGDSARLNFPDNNYRDNGKILDTFCERVKK